MDNSDFPEAAKKHLEDAKSLFIQNRFTGSAYLTGYVYECILKTFLQIDKGISKIHDLNQLSSEAITCGSLTGKKTAKYHRAFQFNKVTYDKNGKQGWGEIIRYFDEEFLDEQKADKWLTDAENFYNASIRQMKLDGLV